VTVYYADTSALLVSYLPDEAGSAALRALLLEGRDPVLACRLVDVEVPRALVTGVRRGRIPAGRLGALLDQYDRDVGSRRRVELLGLDTAALERARDLVTRHPLRTLDAIHLAVADGDGRRLAGREDDLVFVTRVPAQAAAAAALGLATFG
jgi:predicted nucleic acid-binding protein